MPSTPVVIVPMQVKAEPVKVKFASASNSVVVEPIVVNSLAVALLIAVTVPAEASSHATAAPAPPEVKT